METTPPETVAIQVPRFCDEHGPTCEGCAFFRPCSLQPSTVGWCHAPRVVDDPWQVRNQIPHLECPLWREMLGALEMARVEIPDLTPEDMERVTGREYFNGLRDGYEIARSRARVVYPGGDPA